MTKQWEVSGLGLSSEGLKGRDCDYAKVTRIMHLHNDYAKFMQSDYAKFRQTVVPLQGRVPHHLAPLGGGHGRLRLVHDSAWREPAAAALGRLVMSRLTSRLF